jgi:hypothetical protein
MFDNRPMCEIQKERLCRDKADLLKLLSRNAGNCGLFESISELKRPHRMGIPKTE